MSERPSEPLHRLKPALLAAVLNRGLRSILLFDVTRPVLDAVADALEQMLLVETDRVVVRRYLGAAQHEDDLWIRTDLSLEDERLAVSFRPGALTGDVDGAHLPLMVIPDLAELSLAAARGCVTLIGADVAHLERHGASLQWLPDSCWLAACDRAAIGKVSPHLLDRFAIRLDAAWSLSAQERVKDIQRSALGMSGLQRRLFKQESDQVHTTATVRPEITPEIPDRSEMIERILDILPSGEGISPRREITLARLAAAYGRLVDPSKPVGREHVDQAAMLLGLTLPVVGNEPDDTRIGTEGAPFTKPDVPLDPSIKAAASSEAPLEDTWAETAPVEQTVLAPDSPELLSQAQLPDERTGPYPEDRAVRERDMTALREGPTRSRSTTVPRGPIIGVQQAQSAHDLALLNTVLAAAMWQPYRRSHVANGAEGNRLWLLPSDLRSYRRAPVPEKLLTLIIDYTCLEGWDWTAPLLSYLRWAYVERAGLVLVRVGAEDNPVETQADRLITRSLLDPRLDFALGARSGRATPLAHGLFLALQALRHGLQHGEGTVRHARLVLVTDGRGNIPLELDADLKVTGIVGRTGIEDALKVAASIRTMAAVETILVDPGPDLYPELVLELARALGADLVKGRPAEGTKEAKAT